MRTNIILADETTSPLDLKLSLIPTTNDTGEWAGDLFHEPIENTATLQSGITTYMSVPYKMNITGMNAVTKPVSSAYTCDFIPGTDITLNDVVVSPVRFSAMVEICQSELWQTWFAGRKRQGVENNEPALNQFMSYLQAYILKLAAKDFENIAWNASTLTGTGVLGLTNGYVQYAITNGATVIPAVAVTPANIISILTSIVTATPSAVSSQPDYTIFCNTKMANFYTMALAGNGGSPYFNAYNGSVTANTLLGLVKIQVIPGMADNQFLAGSAANLVLAADMTSMQNALRIDRVQNLSDNLGMRLDYTLDTAIMKSNEIIVVA
jgi:hypothetical protein